MVQFLSDNWFEQLQGALSQVTPPPQATAIQVEYQVDGDTYHVRLSHTGVTVHRGSAASPTVVFAQNGLIASDIIAGRLLAPAAVLAGNIRVSGDPSLLLNWQAAVATISAALANLAKDTVTSAAL